jgi:hypothetical protein
VDAVTSPAEHAESRARKKIRQAVEAKGYTITRFDWEPIRPGGEKEGLEGGWYLEVRAPSGGEDWVMGLNWRDAVEWADRFLKPDKTTPLGIYP